MIDLLRYRHLINKRRRQKAIVCATLVLAPFAFASGTATWEMNSYADFIRGRFSGISLSRDGRVSLAPKVDPVFASDQPAIWSIARAPDGTLYAATGNRGRVYRIDGAGKSSLLWTAEQPEVFAIAVDRKGVVYAATSPDGAVYRIADGKATEYFAPQSRYIWSLTVGPDGALYVGTGDQGKIFRVDSAGKGELYYDTGQQHITGLAVDTQGRLLAGTEPNGILYRISAKDKAFVLYDSGLPEIRAIVPMPDGTVYAAALGGSVARRAQAAGQGTQNANPAGTVPTVTTTVTVEAQSSEIKPPDATKPQTQRAAPVPTTPTAQATPLPEASGAEKSAVYRINADNTVETLWSSKEENAYDLLALEKQVLFATDQNGRIYGLTPDRRVTLITETGEGETTRLLSSGNSVLAATSDSGRIFRLGESPGAAGEMEAPVHDAGAVARWGSVGWRAETPTGCSVAFRTRTGNSAKPDRTWSDWSAPLTDPAGSRISSPNARYIQWKMEMAGSGGATPVLNGVTVAYLPQNSPPVVTGINVSTQAGAAQSAKASSDASTVTVSATADASSAVLSHASNSQITVAWQAEDPDGDRLVYDVSFRGEDQTQWIPLKSGTHDNSISFDDDMFADGKYFFRVVASDREANPPSSARETQSVSAAVLIDNTPPVATLGTVRRDGATAHIEFEAADRTSPLRRCEYSVDASGWVPIEAAGGIVDGLREKFTLDLKDLAPGEHLLVIRVGDSAGNTGVAKALLK
jgi:sugar lactone lactonase YvrE